MKPWQANVITLCAVIICLNQLYQALFLANVHYAINLLSDEVDRLMGGAASTHVAPSSNKDWDEAIRKAKEPGFLESLLPEKPKARAYRSDGQ